MSAPGCTPSRRAGLFALAGGRFAALIGLPFGRCDAAVLDRLGSGIEASAAEIRLSPWRGLAFRDLDRPQAESLLMLRDGDQPGEIYVLRLWPADTPLTSQALLP